MTDALRRTYKKVVSMLKENTGMSILDSGDYYGRHWQINQKKDFLKEPPFDLEVWECDYCRGFQSENKHGCSEKVCAHPEIIVNGSLFWYMLQHLEWTEKAEQIEKEFYQFAQRVDPEGEMTWGEIYLEFVRANNFRQVVDLNNTYNDPDYYYLSQVVYWAAFEMENEIPFIWIQVHNGCDVRGGYTRPAIFETSWYVDSTGLFYDDYVELEFDDGTIIEFYQGSSWTDIDKQIKPIFYDKEKEKLFVWNGEKRAYLSSIQGIGLDPYTIKEIRSELVDRQKLIS